MSTCRDALFAFPPAQQHLGCLYHDECQGLAVGLHTKGLNKECNAGGSHNLGGVAKGVQPDHLAPALSQRVQALAQEGAACRHVSAAEPGDSPQLSTVATSMRELPRLDASTAPLSDAVAWQSLPNAPNLRQWVQQVMSAANMRVLRHMVQHHHARATHADAEPRGSMS